MTSRSPARESLLRILASIEAERVEARPVVSRLRNDIPAETWDSRIPAEWRTAGFVQELTTEAAAIRDHDPSQSLSMTLLALAVIPSLSSDQYPGPTIAQLEGTAWCEIGNTHFRQNVYEAALDAYQRAERSFSREPSLFDDSLRARLARAWISVFIQNAADAKRMNDSIPETILSDDLRLRVASRFLDVVLELQSGNFETALTKFAQIQELAQNTPFADDVSSFLTRVIAAFAEISKEDVNTRAHSLENFILDVLATVTAATAALHHPTSLETTIDELLCLPVDEAEGLIRREPRFQTAELTERLVDLTEEQTDLDPPYARKIAKLAVAAAESLSGSIHSAETLAFLRGSAYRQMGVTLYYGSRYPEALQAYEMADKAFDGSAAATYEKGRVAMHRTIVLIALDRHDEAMASARHSQQAFTTYADPRRLASALFAEALVHSKLGDWRTPLRIFLGIRRDVMDILDIEMQARVQTNIALSYRNLGDLNAAANEYYLAVRLFEQSGTKSEVARMHWQLASLTLAEGKIDEALRRFDEAARELLALGMAVEAAGARLEAAETLLAIGEHQRAAVLCRAVLDQYQASGMGHTKRAMTALAYLNEAARLSRATPELVRHVKNFLERLPQEPTLLFAPPPEPPDKRD